MSISTTIITPKETVFRESEFCEVLNRDINERIVYRVGQKIDPRIIVELLRIKDFIADRRADRLPGSFQEYEIHPKVKAAEPVVTENAPQLKPAKGGVR